jgi:molybdopterin-biosynthesis enzyme MoeA-like protein
MKNFLAITWEALPDINPGHKQKLAEAYKKYYGVFPKEIEAMLPHSLTACQNSLTVCKKSLKTAQISESEINAQLEELRVSTSLCSAQDAQIEAERKKLETFIPASNDLARAYTDYKKALTEDVDITQKLQALVRAFCLAQESRTISQKSLNELGIPIPVLIPDENAIAAILKIHNIDIYNICKEKK